VDLDGAPDADEDTNIAEVEEFDAAGGKTIRKIGPMEQHKGDPAAINH